ncbi:unnamed protein product [Tilletia controversa]|uniref:NAD(P)-binding protein n=3 Tax=Tilletia TaxID=13289 RepID=A0A8X7MPY2_9BASI|nr:hypothetical protein CF336_g6323 [Tilletia laevis]KAE8193446.1 hypothetical protein CF328_g5046 [Tilletia controversa]KAE8249349.1 hypothetical protein A4X03_0g6625 [Tilletia caries]KAE8189665.1 hypothetical protein CF335_g6565 [Tilletia laevis]KAE8244859.1 hypothetical protein A4X06_0g5938 [Tilletia controversa]
MTLLEPVVFITGGAGHIGRAIAKEWIARHARAIVLTDLDQQALDGAVAELAEAAKVASSSSPTQIKGIKADASVWSEINNALEQTVAELGSVEYVFANAGAVKSASVDLSVPQEPGADWYSLFDSHFKTTLNTIHAAIPRLAKSDAADKLLIVTSSASSFSRFSYNPPYGIAKTAINQIVLNYRDLLPAGVRMTAFAPNWVLTPQIAPLAPLLAGPKTIEETIAAMMTHVDDHEANGIVTVHEPDGRLHNVEPYYVNRSDCSIKMAQEIQQFQLRAQKQQQ